MAIGDMSTKLTFLLNSGILIIVNQVDIRRGVNILYKINDLVLYSTHGICKVTDITDKNFSDEIKSYYELRPLKDIKLQIHIPVGSTKIQMFDLMNEKEAIGFLESFKFAEKITFEKNYFVSQNYNKMIAEADRSRTVSTIYSLLLRKKQVTTDGKKLPIQESKALINLQGILYNELALALKKSYAEVEAMIEENIAVAN